SARERGQESAARGDPLAADLIGVNQAFAKEIESLTCGLPDLIGDRGGAPDRPVELINLEGHFRLRQSNDEAELIDRTYSEATSTSSGYSAELSDCKRKPCFASKLRTGPGFRSS